MSTEPDDRTQRALDTFSRQATAAAPTRIPSLAALRRRAAQRRRRRTIARLAFPLAALAALGAWAILDPGDEPTQLAVVSESETAPETPDPSADNEATPKPAAPEEGAPEDPTNGADPTAIAESTGQFVWPDPPRGFATLEELVDQFAVEVLGWYPGTVSLEDEDITGEDPQAFAFYQPDPDQTIPIEYFVTDHYAVAALSPEGWGFIQVGSGDVGIDETSDGGYVIGFQPPVGTVVNTVEVRYTDGEITSDTTKVSELVLQPGRSAGSVESVLITHAIDTGEVISASGSLFTPEAQEIPDQIQSPFDVLQGVAVPNLVGLDVNEAVTILDEWDFKLADIDYDEGAEEPFGTVVATEPVPDDLIEFSGPISLTVASGGPSQSPADAIRDQVVPEVAALPAGIRGRQVIESVDPTHIAASEGIWVISEVHPRIAFALTPDCGLGNLGTDSVYRRDVICLTEYAEIILFDPQDGSILRAYPFPGIPPSSLRITDDALYCSRQGDGALPDSMLCRIDRITLEPTVKVFPAGPSQDSAYWSWTPRGWSVEEPVDLVLWEHLAVTDDGIAISGHDGTAVVDPDTLEIGAVTASTPSQSATDAARDQVVTGLATLPVHARVRPIEAWSGRSTRIDTPEGTWMISEPGSEPFPGANDGCTLGEGVYRVDYVCFGEYAEILLLDHRSGAILRAYPLPGVPPQNLHVTDEAIYCFRSGDGTLPVHVLCRIDRTTLELAVAVFPFFPDSKRPAKTLPGWTFDELTDDEWEHMTFQYPDDYSDYVFSLWGETVVIDGSTQEFLSIEVND